MTTMRTLRLAAPLLSLLAACNLDTPKQYLVPDLRILAIRASAGGGPLSDADIDEPVLLEALIYVPPWRTDVRLDWYACLPSTPQAISPCVDPEVLRNPAAIPANPAFFHFASSSTPLPPDPPILPTSASLTLPPEWESMANVATQALIAQATATPGLQCQLYFDLPVLAVVSDGEVTELAVKYVRIAPSAAREAFPDFPDAYVLNRNPAIEALETNPADEDACTGGTVLADPLPAGEVTVCARPTPESRQTYSQCTDDGPPPAPDTEEELSWQWYVSAGEIAQGGFDGNATGNPIDLKPAAVPFTLWTIVRDGRGGTAWTATDLNL